VAEGVAVGDGVLALVEAVSFFEQAVVRQRETGNIIAIARDRKETWIFIISVLHRFAAATGQCGVYRFLKNPEQRPTGASIFVLRRNNSLSKFDRILGVSVQDWKAPLSVE
jgi:hypothetical protein